ncbi:unnamed protein product [Cyprideis torosa]|uniref:Uncharacterized protein n=1 Tax=Cyprideis torosa TaxID=163714 RepID=A0A7R8WDM8_9CRUS|nr:unnamed protein product [Cyprideis torosa]CAG0894885.1 unnamed protein product [Cyprideis torosa]
MDKWNLFGVFIVFYGSLFLTVVGDEISPPVPNREKVGPFRIEGKVLPPTDSPGPRLLYSMQTTQILINGGEHVGFPRADGSFVIDGLPRGSYLLEVNTPNHVYEPFKVDINSKGKIRSRKVNWIQPSQITQVPYPVKMKARGSFKYFQQREQWRITDFIFSPMVLMMVLPLILIMVLPKMVNDPEARKEMEQFQMPKYDMPDLSELLTSTLGGDKAKGVAGAKNRKSK